ncbi:MAG: saccharopine dehydrogenase NADP-binding domain-containing protein [Propionibacteriaceae bacterium]|jgi:hypothetical protein|nr:saccharopine dehydrogenase NADP-binding domain-containing protein [Propionibacteriaceae bacterium]
MKRVLVLGGTGVSGRAVVEELRAAAPDADVAYSGRRPDGRLAVPYVHFDTAADRAANVRTLSAFDWVVMAVGPFERTRASLHGLCVEAGVNCVDINDSIDARRDIVALAGRARQAGVTMLTGCGLCPGLSTLLLAGAAGAGWALPAVAVRSTLLIGAKQEPGTASLQSMFETLGSPYRVLRGGRETRRPAAVERGSAGGPPYLVGYECPDLDIVAGLFPGLLDYDYRVCFAQLDADRVEALARARWLRRPWAARRLARLAARVGARRVAKTGAVPDNAVLTVEAADDQGRTVRLTATGRSSYGLTAAMAVAVYTAATTGVLEPGPGVFEVRDLAAVHPWLRDALSRRGVVLAAA